MSEFYEDDEGLEVVLQAYAEGEYGTTCICGTPDGVPHFCTGDPKRNGHTAFWESRDRR